MRGKIFLVLLFTVIVGIQPVLAQSGSDASTKPAATEKPAQREEVVIDINLASDDEFVKALEAAGDIELLNEDSSAKTTNQEKAK